MKSLVHYSRTLDSTYNIFSQEAFINNFSKDLVWCGLVQGVAESVYRCYVCLTKLVQLFPEPLRLVERINEETAGSILISRRRSLAVTHLDHAVLSNADEHDLPLYVRAADAQAQGQK